MPKLRLAIVIGQTDLAGHESQRVGAEKTSYYMSMLDRRLQVLIDGERWARLEHEAARRHVSVSTVVREAIDDRYPSNAEMQRTALEAFLDADVMDVPPPGGLRRELDAARGGRIR